MKPSNCTTTCNFFRHATCASRMINNRDWLTNGCVPACNSYAFQQESIQYVQMSQKISEAIRRQSGDMSLTSIVLNLAEGMLKSLIFLTPTLSGFELALAGELSLGTPFTFNLPYFDLFLIFYLKSF